MTNSLVASDTSKVIWETPSKCFPWFPKFLYLSQTVLPDSECPVLNHSFNIFSFLKPNWGSSLQASGLVKHFPPWSAGSSHGFKSTLYAFGWTIPWSLFHDIESNIFVTTGSGFTTPEVDGLPDFYLSCSDHKLGLEYLSPVPNRQLQASFYCSKLSQDSYVWLILTTHIYEAPIIESLEQFLSNNELSNFIIFQCEILRSEF